MGCPEFDRNLTNFKGEPEVFQSSGQSGRQQGGALLQHGATDCCLASRPPAIWPSTQFFLQEAHMQIRLVLRGRQL